MYANTELLIFSFLFFLFFFFYTCVYTFFIVISRGFIIDFCSSFITSIPFSFHMFLTVISFYQICFIKIIIFSRVYVIIFFKGNLIFSPIFLNFSKEIINGINF